MFYKGAFDESKPHYKPILSNAAFRIVGQSHLPAMPGFEVV
jgi:hypothetical protein